MLQILNKLIYFTFSVGLIIMLTSCSCNKKSTQVSSTLDPLLQFDSKTDQALKKIHSPDFEFSEPEFILYDSGLKTQIIHQGPNDTQFPLKGQTVCIHYICLQDEENKTDDPLYDSYEQGLPVEFKLGAQETFLGLEEGIMHMRIGDKHRLYIPSELTFGKFAKNKLIPTSTDLIYEVELLDIK